MPFRLRDVTPRGGGPVTRPSDAPFTIALTAVNDVNRKNRNRDVLVVAVRGAVLREA